jgi:hypothetical protein
VRIPKGALFVAGVGPIFSAGVVEEEEEEEEEEEDADEDTGGGPLPSCLEPRWLNTGMLLLF